jgi:DNA-binding NtrC family response regulator
MAPRILVVDDDRRVLFVLRHTVQGVGDGYEIVAARGAEAALDKVAGHPLALVITDLSMDGMNGVDMTEKIRAWLPDVPVIWITAHGCHRFEKSAQALDIFRCLDKPLEISTIRQVAREALRIEENSTDK